MHFPPLFGYNSTFLFYPLKYKSVPQSLWRLRTRKYHPGMRADGLQLACAHLCRAPVSTDAPCAGKGSQAALQKWTAASFLPEMPLKTRLKTTFWQLVCVCIKNIIKQIKFLVSSTKLLDLRLAGICFWTEEGNICVKFPLIYKAETSAGSAVTGHL